MSAMLAAATTVSGTAATAVDTGLASGSAAGAGAETGETGAALEVEVEAVDEMTTAVTVLASGLVVLTAAATAVGVHTAGVGAVALTGIAIDPATADPEMGVPDITRPVMDIKAESAVAQMGRVGNAAAQAVAEGSAAIPEPTSKLEQQSAHGYQCHLCGPEAQV